MSVKTIFLTSPHSNFFRARKVECGDVRKIVARGEIEMIKKRGASAELSTRDATNHGTKIGMWGCRENSSKG